MTRSFQSLVLINALILLTLVFLNNDTFAQNDMQQLRLAQSLEKGRQYEAALKIYRNLENNNKLKLAVEKGIRKCLTGLQRYDELVIYLEKLVEKNNSENKYINSLAEAYLLNSDNKKALNVWNTLINQNKNNSRVYRMVASTMIKNRMIENAILVYETAIQNVPKQEILHLDIANLYKSVLNMEKAAEHFLQYYSRFPQQKSFLQRQILNLTKKEQHVDLVANQLNEFIKQNPKKLFVKEILAGLYIKSKQFDRAFDIYSSLESSKKNGKYLFEFGSQAQKNNAFQYAAKAFNQVLKNENLPIYTQAYYQLARTYLLMAQQNRDDNASVLNAIKMFEKLLSRNSIQEFSDLSSMYLGDIYVDFYFDLDKAIYYYGLVNSKYPKSKKRSKSLIKLGDCYLMKGDLKLSGNTYNKDNNKKNFAMLTYKLAELDYYQGNLNEALQKYNSIVEKAGIADSLANNALERTIFINSFLSDSSDLKSFAYGELLIFQQKYSEAIEHLNKLLIKNNNIASSAGRKIAKILLKQKKYSEANEILNMLIEAYPNDFFADEFLFKNAQVEEILGNHQRSFELYQMILNKFETSLYYEEAREKARLLNEIIKKEQISG